MGYRAIIDKLPSRVLSENLEDVLTASVVGAVAYGPPAMAQDWLRSYAGMDQASADLVFEFWPEHRLEGGKVREPDVFILDKASRQGLIVEAKREKNPHRRQLIDEGKAARLRHPDVDIHLLTVSNWSVRPTAFKGIETEQPRLFTTMRHVSWTALYVFLQEWSTRPATDAGHRRMIMDALAVLEKFGREPFRGVERQEVSAMERDVRWSIALPVALVKLHRRLEGRLGNSARPFMPSAATSIPTT